MKRRTKAHKKQAGKRLMRRLGRLLLAVAGALLVLGLAVFAWHWRTTLPLKTVSVSGTLHASAEDIRELARVDSVQTLYAVDPQMIAERVRRHDWIEEVRVRRLPTGTLSIRVAERVPVALALDTDGRPACYVDRAGYQMPLVDGARYDVPLLRGIKTPCRPRQAAEDPALIAFLGVLAVADEDADALISEVHTNGRGDVTLYTTPPDGRGTIPVRLGKGDFDRKLQRMVAFWRQAVLTREDRKFELIDLRFDNQVVTREKVLQ